MGKDSSAARQNLFVFASSSWRRNKRGRTGIDIVEGVTLSPSGLLISSGRLWEAGGSGCGTEAGHAASLITTDIAKRREGERDGGSVSGGGGSREREREGEDPCSLFN